MSEIKKTYIIAEAGVNHNGSVEMAKQLIDVAVESGVDAVKFQTFKTEQVVTRDAPKADYQKKTTGNVESQFEMIKKLELDENDHLLLVRYCKDKTIQFISSPFDFESVDFLVNSCNVPYLKIGSGEITNAPLLLKAAYSGKQIILSTGMSTLSEVEEALGVLAFGYLKSIAKETPEEFRLAYCSHAGQQVLKEKVVLLHCTTEYPSAFCDVNLRAMDTMRMAFDLPVGFSDHTPGIAMPIAAAARGAILIEKHFTLNRELLGPDHRASLEPNELKAMVESIREVELALGTGVKIPVFAEMGNRRITRKSIVVTKNIKQGEYFTNDNIATKRPGIGVSPMHYWEYLDKISTREYIKDDLI